PLILLIFDSSLYLSRTSSLASFDASSIAFELFTPFFSLIRTRLQLNSKDTILLIGYALLHKNLSFRTALYLYLRCSTSFLHYQKLQRSLRPSSDLFSYVHTHHLTL